MKFVRLSILILLVIAGALLVIDTPGPAGAEQASHAATPGSEVDSGSSSAGSSPTEAGPEAEGEDQSLETFIPTEKLPADSAISFPVDI